MLEKQWSGLVWPASSGAARNPETGVSKDVLQHIGKASITVPENFVSAFNYFLSCCLPKHAHVFPR